MTDNDRDATRYDAAAELAARAAPTERWTRLADEEWQTLLNFAPSNWRQELHVLRTVRSRVPALLADWRAATERAEAAERLLMTERDAVRQLLTDAYEMLDGYVSGGTMMVLCDDHGNAITAADVMQRLTAAAPPDAGKE